MTTATQSAFVLEGEPPIALSPNDIKALVRHRDGYRCTECGITATEHILNTGRSLDVHRLDPGSEYTLEGCVTMCRSCHGPQPRTEWGQRKGPKTIAIRGEIAALMKEYQSKLKPRPPMNAIIHEAVVELLTKEGFWPLPSKKPAADE